MVTYKDLHAAAKGLLECMPSPYHAWHSGYVSHGDGPPAWGVNAPPPDPAEVRSRGAFCGFVPNWMYRSLGLTIPNPYNDVRYDGGIVSYWEAYYSASEWFYPTVSYPDGTFVMSPYNSASLGDQGHIAMVWNYGGTPYCIEWILNGGGTWRYTLAQSNSWGQYSIAIRPEVWVPLAGGEYGATAPPTTDPMKYPGDLADPDVVARWMARVAYKDYGLPPVLPVMCSYVELTGAWTGPGDVRTVPGYLYNVDHCSVGYMQQQASDLGCGDFGWGTWAQITNADYALRKFCQVAYDKSGGRWNKDQTDPHILGQWVQAVQGSAYPNAYRDKGYPAAIKLIQGWEEEKPVEPTKPGKDKELWEEFGWYGWKSRDSWDLVFFPPEGRDSPVAEPEWKRAVSKTQKVEYREQDGEVEVKEPDGSLLTYSSSQFQELYEPIKEN